MSGRQRGMAVLTVLLLIALMTLLAVNSQAYFQQSVRGAQSMRFALQAGWSLLGAESWLIRQPPATPQGVQQLQLEQDLIHFQWRDRQACFNLNTLKSKKSGGDVSDAAAPAGSRGKRSSPDARAEPAKTGETRQPPAANADAAERLTAAQRVFIALLAELGVAPARAKSLTLSLSAQLQQGDFIEPSELRDPATGFDAVLWPQLAPMLCALPADRLQININGLTASQLPLLTALFEGALSASQARELLNSRPASGWKTLTAMLADTRRPATGENSALLLSVAVTQSHAWELLLWTGDGSRGSSLRSRLILRDGQLQVTNRLYGLSE